MAFEPKERMDRCNELLKVNFSKVLKRERKELGDKLAGPIDEKTIITEIISHLKSMVYDTKMIVRTVLNLAD